MSTDAQHEHVAAQGGRHYHAENAIHMPAPTQWPLIMAVGLTLIFAGLVTNFMISLLGVVMGYRRGGGLVPAGAAAGSARTAAGGR